MNPNNKNLILLPVEDSKTNYLNGFWRWVTILANDDYQCAVDSLYWSSRASWNAESLKQNVSTFFGGNEQWHVVIPNERLVSVINDSAEFQQENTEGWGWLKAHIPVTTEPEKSKDDDISLMGISSSFFIRKYNGHFVMELEIFHM